MGAGKSMFTNELRVENERSIARNVQERMSREPIDTDPAGPWPPRLLPAKWLDPDEPDHTLRIAEILLGMDDIGTLAGRRKILVRLRKA